MIDALKRENLVGKSVTELNQLCREHSVKGVIGRPKKDMIEYMVAFNEGRKIEEAPAAQPAAPAQPAAQVETPAASNPADKKEGWVSLDQVQSS